MSKLGLSANEDASKTLKPRFYWKIATNNGLEYPIFIHTHTVRILVEIIRKAVAGKMIMSIDQ